MTITLVNAAHLPRRRAPLFGLLALCFVAAACDTNPYDASQRPMVIVTPVSTSPFVEISWQPAGAQLVRVYRGTVVGDGYGESLMWSIAANGSNSLVSAVSYGDASPTGGTTDVAAKPLVRGERYTVEVTRRDPKGSGDGFTNTKNRYVGTATFTYAAP